MKLGMFNPSVKSSTSVRIGMQILCLTFFWLLLLSLGQNARAQAGGSHNPVQAAQVMSDQVRQWMANAHKVNAKDVAIAPLDERLKVQSCAKPLAIDHPFSSKETVRVRCVEPTWQLFLQVTLPSQQAVVAASSSASPGRPALVAKRLLQRGTILTPDMLEEVQVSTAQVDTQLLSTMKDVEQAELTRDVMAGQALRSSDVKRAVLVKQGQTVTMAVGEKSTFQILVRMEALQEGRFGEQVKLRNPESGRQVSGVVTGLNTVKGL
jgi:flagella basal body P-ring formation protein FlgA